MDGIKINFNVAKSLRNRFGFSIEQVVEFAKIKDIKGKKGQDSMPAKDYLHKIEIGELYPTKKVLENLSALYRVPLLTFFLPEPPIFCDELIDFRTFESKRPRVDNPVIFALKRKIKLLQNELANIERENDIRPKNFVATIKPTIPTAEFVQIVRDVIGFSLEQQKALKKSDDLFKIIRKHIEMAGIFVIQLGDLGSYHTSIPTSEFRGIAISEKYAPLIVINPNDIPAAQLFSLLHELAHIFLGDTSISNVGLNNHDGNDKEKICNAFAAEFLLPLAEIHHIENMKKCNVDEILSVASDIGYKYHVSNMVVIRRLYDTNKITKETFNKANSLIAANFKNRKQVSKTDGGPNKNIVDKSRLGERTVQAINFATEQNLLSPSAAAAILGINVGRLYKVIS